MFNDIESLISWLTARKSTAYSFEHFKSVCHSLNDPQDALYVIHVAGTDGKGSTVNYLAALLRSQGLKVGTFTSPHYVKHQDRIRIDEENIPDDVLLRIVNEDYDFYVQNGLSMFEIDYLVMCRYFTEEKVDVAIVEVGLGGRLDSTNVISRPNLSIITTIGYDHMDRLGPTLAAICREKCGIIKNDSTVLIGRLDDECRAICRQTALERNCRFHELDHYEDLGSRRFLFHDREYELLSYASYQLHNASLALQAFELIAKDRELVIDYPSAAKALKETSWACRFEVVRKKPIVILDGAHNIHGIQALCESFDRFSGSKCIVFSALKRKQYHEMIAILKSHCDRLVITTFPFEGAIDIADFNDECTQADYHQAIDEAIKTYDNVLICGSLYFLSEVVLNHKFA